MRRRPEAIEGVLENITVPLPEQGGEKSDTLPPIPPIMRALKQALEKETTEEAKIQYKKLLDTASRPMSPETRRLILGILLAEQLDTAGVAKSH